AGFRPAPGPFTATKLATAYAYASFGEEMVSLVTKLEFCRLVFGRLDKSLCDKLIKKSPFVRLQIRAGSLQQIAKDRNFQVRDIIICHDMECARDGGQFAGWELTGAAGLSEDESHGQAPHP
ncbi:MAG: hypothetical protein WCF55_17750, partial [Pseudolabrys sp.]